MLKIIFMLLSAIPLCLHIPYLLSAWGSSRLDQWDWMFYLLTIPAGFAACRKTETDKHDKTALLLLVPALVLALTDSFYRINALGIAASSVCIFAAVWLLYSWRLAGRVLPAAVILLLGTPSSSYAISLLLMCPVWAAWAIKFLLAVLCFILIGCTRRFNWQVKPGTLFFLAALLSSGLLLLHSKEIYFEGKSFVPAFPTHVGGYWGRRIQPDANTKRFFATSHVRQYRYTKSNMDISVLAVKCGKDIHEIHPASHCLRTGLWTIHSETILYLQDNFAVTEIDAEKGSNRILTWVWYSTQRFSTPGFLGFRRHFRSGKDHYTYQISIPTYNDIDRSRMELRQFIRSLNNSGKNIITGRKK
jgi:hypothetical protein